MNRKYIIIAVILLLLLALYIGIYYDRDTSISGDENQSVNPKKLYDLLKEQPENSDEIQYFFTKGDDTPTQSEIKIRGKNATIKYPLDEDMTDPQKDIAGRNAVLLFAMYPDITSVEVNLKDQVNLYHPVTREETERLLDMEYPEEQPSSKEFIKLYEALEDIDFTDIWVYSNEEKIMPTHDIVTAIRQGLKQLYPAKGVGNPEVMTFAWKEMGSERSGEKVILYLFVHYDGYNYVNGNFVSVLGADDYVKIALDKTKDGSYIFDSGKKAGNGVSPYDVVPMELIEEFEPEQYSKELAAETYAQAEDYVAESGRDAKVYRASRAPSLKYIQPLLHDGGKSMPKGYPLFQGSIEYLVGPDRTIYETEYDRKENEITLYQKDEEENILHKETLQPVVSD